MEFLHRLRLFDFTMNGHHIRLATLILFLPLLISLSLLASLTANAQNTSILPNNEREIRKEKMLEKKERQRIISSSIHSITSTRYSYRFGKIDPKGVIEFVRRYNGDGRLVEETIYNLIDGSLQTRKTYRYDSRGNLIEENNTANGETIKTIHRYTGSDRKRETIHYKSNGTIDKKISFIYDEHGLLLETVGYLNDGRLYLRESVLYDNDGNIAERKNSLHKFLYRYDQRKNVITISKYARIFTLTDSAHYGLTDRYEFAYDRTDNMAGMISYKSDSTVRARFEYLIDIDGHLTGEKEFNHENKLMFQRKTVYGKNDNVVEESGTDRGIFFRSTYKYDSKGNKTETIEYDQINEPKYLVKYTFGRSSWNKNQQLPGKSFDSSSTESNGLVDIAEFEPYIGGRLVAPDGAYLGAIMPDTTDSQSIINSWGQYGFNESPTSIFNPSIPYGGKDGVFSPFNPSSPSPPSIYKEGKFFAYCTENENFRPRCSPHKLISFLRQAAQKQ